MSNKSMTSVSVSRSRVVTSFRTRAAYVAEALARRADGEKTGRGDFFRMLMPCDEDAVMLELLVDSAVEVLGGRMPSVCLDVSGEGVTMTPLRPLRCLAETAERTLSAAVARVMVWLWFRMRMVPIPDADLLAMQQTDTARAAAALVAVAAPPRPRANPRPYPPI